MQIRVAAKALMDVHPIWLTHGSMTFDLIALGRHLPILSSERYQQPPRAIFVRRPKRSVTHLLTTCFPLTRRLVMTSRFAVMWAVEPSCFAELFKYVFAVGPS